MGTHRAATPWRSTLRKITTASLAGAVAFGTATAIGSPAQATQTVNPFDVNQGFTIVAQGDAVLGNNELEGSIAVFGSIASNGANGGGSGYPLRHQAAGLGDYAVPTVDGVPVRVLADRFTGSKPFEQTNAGSSAGTPERAATSRFVDVSNLNGTSRGSNFLRLTNDQGGIFDLNEVPFSPTATSKLQTQRDSVQAYFPALNDQVVQANRCLADLGTAGGPGNAVTVTGQGNMVFVEGFAQDRPNVIDYDAIAGKIIKLDRAGGYRPTADAPLVVRVDEGTNRIGRLNFEGWSAAGSGQSLSRFIMLDLSTVTGDVTVDGLEMGAIWAPTSNLSFNSNITTNGQWFAQSVRTGPSSGEIHHHTFAGRLPCGANTPPVQPEPELEPWIGTTVAVDGTDDKILPLTGGTVTDTVAYENLDPDTSYELRGEIHDVDTGDSTHITAETTFTPEAADGTVDVTFDIDADQITDYAGRDLVVFEYLATSEDPDTVIAEHTDLHDEAQTFTVADLEEPPTETETEPEFEQVVSSTSVTGSPASEDADHTAEAAAEAAVASGDERIGQGPLPTTGASGSSWLPYLAALLLTMGAGTLLLGRARRA